MVIGFSDAAGEMQVATFQQVSNFDAVISYAAATPNPWGDGARIPMEINGLVKLARDQVDAIKREGRTLGREIAAGGRLIAAIVERTEVRLAPAYDFETNTFLGPYQQRPAGFGGFTMGRLR